MPALFIGHGSPMNTLETNRYTAGWRALGAALPRPSGIVCISAHWQTRGLAVTAMPAPRTIHDFHGFPPALYQVRYPAPGSAALAERVAAALQPLPVALDTRWGLDHGAWSVLVHLWPAADVPVVQLSLDATQPAAFHHALGARLAALRAQGVLLLGSGNVVHNLGRLDWHEQRPHPWATRFEAHVRHCLVTGNDAGLVDWKAHGPDAREAIPTPEHYWPLLPIVGARQTGEAAAVVLEGIELRAISMLSVQVS